MSKRKAKTYTAEYKARVALAAIKGDHTINEISSKYGVHSTQINRWKQQALTQIKAGFSDGRKQKSDDNQTKIDELYRQIGELSHENTFLKKRVWD